MKETVKWNVWPDGLPTDGCRLPCYSARCFSEPQKKEIVSCLSTYLLKFQLPSGSDVFDYSVQTVSWATGVEDSCV